MLYIVILLFCLAFIVIDILYSISKNNKGKFRHHKLNKNNINKYKEAPKKEIIKSMIMLPDDIELKAIAKKV